MGSEGGTFSLVDPPGRNRALCLPWLDVRLSPPKSARSEHLMKSVAI